MNGTVKFYNKEKGYGFIFSDKSETDLFFSISDWKNPTVPKGEDDVRFKIKNTKKGLQAYEIKLTKSQADKKKEQYAQNDDRIICPICSKKIVPRCITYKGKVQKTVCPYCSNVIKIFFSPFILQLKSTLLYFGILGVIAILFSYHW